MPRAGVGSRESNGAWGALLGDSPSSGLEPSLGYTFCEFLCLLLLGNLHFVLVVHGSRSFLTLCSLQPGRTLALFQSAEPRLPAAWGHSMPSSCPLPSGSRVGLDPGPQQGCEYPHTHTQSHTHPTAPVLPTPPSSRKEPSLMSCGCVHCPFWPPLHNSHLLLTCDLPSVSPPSPLEPHSGWYNAPTMSPQPLSQQCHLPTSGDTRPHWSRTPGSLPKCNPFTGPVYPWPGYSLRLSVASLPPLTVVGLAHSA